MIEVPDNVLDLAAALRVILADELGTFSNGQQAIWVEGAPIPTSLSCDGVQCVVSDDYIVRSRKLMTNSQAGVCGLWHLEFVRFGDSKEHVLAYRRTQDKMLRAFSRVAWRPAVPSSMKFKRAICHLEFNTVLNPIQCS